MAFLEILTRYYQRPKAIVHNVASLEAQTDNDWTQTMLIDEVGYGVGQSYIEMGEYAEAGNLEGAYIWILDDDDMCVRPTLVNELKSITESHNPDVIMIRMNHLQRGILPSHSWQQVPKLGDIGCSAYVIRREVFERHAHVFQMGDYSNDFYFIASIFDDSEVDIFWHDVIASQCQRISMGKPEAVV